MQSVFRFGAVIPAAGMSSRMGAFKPLLPCGGSTVIESAVSAALPFAKHVVVVLGNRAEELQRLLKERFGSRVITTMNPDYRATDMLRSVQTGLLALEDCDGFFLLPGDMPAVGEEVFSRLIGAFDGESRVLYPTFEGQKGHPPLIHASLIPQILSYRGDGGLRAVLREYTPSYVAIGDSGITVDLDTPEDYADFIHNSNNEINRKGL